MDLTLFAQEGRLEKIIQRLLLNDEMDPSVFCAGLFAAAGVDGALFAETDRNEPGPFDAFFN